MKPQSRTIIISDINSEKFVELYLKYGEFVSCPCSKITTSYKRFISNRIEFHPVCSSFFVSQQFIESLYVDVRSSYGVLDFRTTAISQVY